MLPDCSVWIRVFLYGQKALVFVRLDRFRSCYREELHFACDMSLTAATAFNCLIYGACFGFALAFRCLRGFQKSSFVHEILICCTLHSIANVSLKRFSKIYGLQYTRRDIVYYPIISWNVGNLKITSAPMRVNSSRNSTTQRRGITIETQEKQCRLTRLNLPIPS